MGEDLENPLKARERANEKVFIHPIPRFWDESTAGEAHRRESAFGPIVLVHCKIVFDVVYDVFPDFDRKLG